MIAYEIQLRYVIWDKIQSETKFSPRQNPRFFFLTIFFVCKRIFIGKKLLVFCFGLNFVSDFQCTFFELSGTNRCLSSLSGMYISQLYGHQQGETSVCRSGWLHANRYGQLHLDFIVTFFAHWS